MNTAFEDYEKALKKGKKEYKNRQAEHRNPYVPVLEEITKHYSCRKEVSLGLKEIPLHLVVGTATSGRANSFTGDFLPLLDTSSEFADKWIQLYNAHLREGITDPIRVIEFMHRFYVVEGNKRVSVMKFFGAVTITAYVSRMAPEFNVKDPKIRLYYEFLQFYRLTGLYEPDLTKVGDYYSLISETGNSLTEPWSKEEVQSFYRLYRRFLLAFDQEEYPVAPGDAFLKLLQVCSYDIIKEAPEQQLREKIYKARKELQLLLQSTEPVLQLNPTEPKKKSVTDELVNLIAPSNPSFHTVGFVYEKTIETSSWTYAHDLGRAQVQDSFPDLNIKTYFNAMADGKGEKVIRQAVEECDVIFTTTPRMLEPSVKLAVEYPEKYIFNCSLNTSYKSIRTYYSRMYEAKFLVGVVAGVLSNEEYIGYVADYPLFGMISNINAFALGVQMTNPNAKIKLVWSKTSDPEELWRGLEGIQYVSGQELFCPQSEDRSFGLYYREGDQSINLVDPIWNWGEYYNRMLYNLKKGTWKQEEHEEKKALNYWWGMSAGVIDLALSERLPLATVRLVNTLRNALEKGELQIFPGSVTPTDIMKMDWLEYNVEGRIPKISELQEEAKEVTKVAGVQEAKDEDTIGF